MSLASSSGCRAGISRQRATVDVLIAPAGPDASRFDPQHSPGVRPVVDGAGGWDLAEVAAVVPSAAERERASRRWCRLCGTFKHPSQGGDETCVDCASLRPVP